MILNRLKLFIRNSKFDYLFLLPVRVKQSMGFTLRTLQVSIKWIFTSREYTNYTYEISARNIVHLAWFVSLITKKDISEIEDYFSEISVGSEFDKYLRMQQMKSKFGKNDSGSHRIGRRLAWYATVRALKPLLVVETGTDKGLGSLVIAEALKKNGKGKLISIDNNPGSGILIGKRHDGILDMQIDDSLNAIHNLSFVDVFIHDSNHSEIHEYKEYEAIFERLTTNGIVLSDNAHASDALEQWSRLQNRQFLYFNEIPSNHWYPGASFSASIDK